MLIQLGTSQCSLGTSSASRISYVPYCNIKGIRTILALCLGRSLGLLLELCGELDVVEEDIGIVEFAVPCSL
jgi:hypothetical protein